MFIIEFKKKKWKASIIIITTITTIATITTNNNNDTCYFIICFHFFTWMGCVGWMLNLFFKMTLFWIDVNMVDVMMGFVGM
jgi:hypothetical protein